MRKPTEQEIRGYSLEDYHVPPGGMPTEQRSERWMLYYLLLLAAIVAIMLALVNT